MVKVICTIDTIIWADINTVRIGEDPLTPRIQKITVRIEDDHGMFAPIERVNAVLRIRGDPRDFDEAPPVRQLLPPDDDLVLDVICTSHNSPRVTAKKSAAMASKQLYHRRIASPLTMGPNP